MPHVIEHIEGDEGFIPLGFSPSTPDDGFIPLGFSEGPPQQVYVPENNSFVTVPAGSTRSLASRESKESIEGQEGLYGNTFMEIFLGAPGGFAEPADLKKLVGGIESAIVDLIAGGSRELVTLGLDVQPGIPFKTKSGEIINIPPSTSSLDRFIQENPEASRKFSAKMLELQNANQDFLIRHGLMFGPDDKPTVLGNLLSQVGPTGFAIGLSVLLRNPAVAALFFGGMQQVAGFEEALEAGKDIRTAKKIADVQGIIEAGISFIGLGVITGAIRRRGASIISKISAGFITEGIEEGVTELLILGVQNLTGVKDMTIQQALIAIFQAAFYGSLAGGGTTGTIAIVQRITDGSVGKQDVEKIARVLDNAVRAETPTIADHVAGDVNTELELDKDIASGNPVTKAAKTIVKQQEKLVKILQMVNDQEEIDIQGEVDEAFPEARIQREKARLKEADVQKAEALPRNVLREALVELDTEMQIAEQEGDEEQIGKIAERINEIQQIAVSTESLREAREELQDEGLFIADSPLLAEALTEIDDVLKPLRAGVRIGEAAQVKLGKTLQKALKKIINRLAREKVIGPDTASRLKDKLGEATSIKTAESVRRDIINQARKAAIRKFRNERLASIEKKITKIADTKKGVLDPDSQNTIDSMDKMRKGRDKAAEVKGFPPQKEQTDEQKAEVAEKRPVQITDYTIKQTTRIQKEMGQGIPSEAVILQVRYLDILNEKTKATPEAIAKFEDDLDAFVATGLGKATAADARDQKVIDDTKAQAKSNKVKDLRSDIENDFFVELDQQFSWWAKTYQSLINALQLRGTPFDLFQPEVDARAEIIRRNREVSALMDDVSSEKDGKSYRKELQSRKNEVIDIPLEGNAKIWRGSKTRKRIKMSRGQLVHAWMMLQNESLRRQITDPDGKMAWSDKFIAMIEEKMSQQDRDFANGLFEIYSRSYERFNEAYRDTHNRDLTRLDLYTHVSRNVTGKEDASTHTETMFIDLIADLDPGLTEKQAAELSESKERIENASSEIIIGDVLSVYETYNYDVEHFISHAKPLSLINKLMADEEFTDHLKDILTPGGFVNFKKHLDFANRRNISHGWSHKLFEIVRGRFFEAKLAANFKIGVGQTATLLAWAPGMPKGALGSGITHYGLNLKKANDILNTHPTFADRALNFDSDIEQLGKIDDIFKFLTLNIRIGDAIAVRAGAWARYKWLTEEMGFSHEKAINDVARFAESSQQSTLPSQRTLAQKSNSPFVRSITMFQSSLNAMFNTSLQSIIEYRQADKSTPKKKAAARSKLLQVIATQNFLIPFLYATLTGRKIATTTIMGTSQGIPIIGELVEVLVILITNIWDEEDEKIFPEGALTDIPLAVAFTEGKRTIIKAKELTGNIIRNGIQEELSKISVGSFIEANQTILEITTGRPVGNLKNMADGIMDFFETDDPLDAGLQVFNLNEAARKRVLGNLEALGLLPSEDSDRIESQPAFGALRQ